MFTSGYYSVPKHCGCSFKMLGHYHRILLFVCVRRKGNWDSKDGVGLKRRRREILRKNRSS